LVVTDASSGEWLALSAVECTEMATEGPEQFVWVAVVDLIRRTDFYELRFDDFSPFYKTDAEIGELIEQYCFYEPDDC